MSERKYYKCMTAEYSDLSRGSVIIEYNLHYWARRRGFKEWHFQKLPTKPTDEEILKALKTGANKDEIIEILELWTK